MVRPTNGARCPTRSGQDQPTSRRQQPTRTSTSQLMSRSNKKQEREKPSNTTAASSTRKARAGATHIPYRSWCPVCLHAKGRSDNHPKQHNKTPVIQCDITCYKAIGEQATSPIFTAIDVETGMYGSTGRRQNTKYAISVDMPSTIPDGCGRTHAVLNNTAIQSGNSHSNGKQHSSTTITSIHRTSTRQGRTFPSNIDGTSESTQATQQHRIHKQASHHAMDGETRSLPVEQECNPRRWQHQLLQALEQGTPNTNL